MSAGLTTCEIISIAQGNDSEAPALIACRKRVPRPSLWWNQTTRNRTRGLFKISHSGAETRQPATAS